MDKRNSLAKQSSELTFWVSRYLERGEKAWTDASGWYCEQLQIDLDAFSDQVVLDIGCGPVASMHSFSARMKVGIDVLARSYQPLGILAHDMVYLAAPAEDLPFVDGFVDAVVSVNALDHVDSFEEAVYEIYRVLKDYGRIFLALNLDHSPTLQEPTMLTMDRVLAALDGNFELDKVFETRLEKALWQQNAPGGVLVIHGRKIPGEQSLYQEATNKLIQELSNGGITFEELDLRYALEYGAPAKIVAERAAATAFVEYRRRTDGWENRMFKDWSTAIRYNPRYLFNRGMISTCLRAVRAKLNRQVASQ